MEFTYSLWNFGAIFQLQRTQGIFLPKYLVISLSNLNIWRRRRERRKWWSHPPCLPACHACPGGLRKSGEKCYCYDNRRTGFSHFLRLNTFFLFHSARGRGRRRISSLRRFFCPSEKGGGTFPPFLAPSGEGKGLLLPACMLVNY